MNSEKKRKTADLLTICIKAGRAVKGFDSSMDVVRDGKAFCVLTAAEAKYDELKAAAETPDEPADEPSDPTGGTPCVYCGEYHDGGLLDKLIIVLHGFLAYFRAFFALFGVNQ